MAKKNLHPSVKKFKEFVKSNPKIIQEVRSGKATWQELYEEWYLLGEDDPRWHLDNERKPEPSGEEQKMDWYSKILGAVKNMDPDKLQWQINNISQALSALQGVIAQFQGQSKSNPIPEKEGPKHPFLFRKD
ncbi:YlbD family protein [Bacillus sp. T33-2]|uniref:YlbD family protein n=1 Tax=Bacillus sp. T33-2 TaxID=2054168 RepID=UPI000C7642F4|nr:YlbD family protein [Bacillus sp. T33-2]PLR97407.1 hypothetical protein CVD19_07915 [Bacillus sp. T33-2]